MRRAFAALAFALAASPGLLALPGLLASPALAQFAPTRKAAPQGPAVHLYGFADYVAPAALDAFARETGVAVTYDSYASVEELEQKLLAGKSGYDLVIAPATLLPRAMAAGALQRLDRALLPRMRGVSPEISTRLAALDPGNLYGVPYLYFVNGIAYDSEKVAKALGGNFTPGLDFLFTPDAIRKLGDCGVELPDSAEEAFAAALAYLRLSPNSRAPADLKRAGDLLARARPHVRSFTPGGVPPQLGGETCVALTTSGAALQGAALGDEAARARFKFAAPREGAMLGIDVLVVPKDAARAGDAQRLADFLLRPDMAAANVAYTLNASPVTEARAAGAKDSATFADAYPPADTLKRAVTPTPPDPAQKKALEREWQRVKASK